MAYFSDVQPGDKFKPDALLSNNVRHHLNALDGFQNGSQKAIRSPSTRVQVYSSRSLQAGMAVRFKTGKRCGDAFNVEPFDDPYDQWGVITEDLESGQIGDCVISGPAKIKMIGDEGSYARPDPEDPTTFIRGATGATILYAAKSNDWSIIDVETYSPEYYAGPFAIQYDELLKKVVVSDGYARKGGKFVDVPGVELDPEDKTICVVWGDPPQIKYEVPSILNYPIGVCSVIPNGRVDTILTSCCRVPVAHFDGDSYFGPFYVYYNDELGKIIVGDGYASRNGEFIHVDGTELSPRDGTICVVTQLSGGEWSSPEIKFATPGKYAFPIGTCDVFGSGKDRIVEVYCCRTSVAVFIVTAECPIAAKEPEDGNAKGIE